ncbi:MAG: S41 family peptidase [Chlorobiaceae bacterium]|nr:S41 family peptidase [Chlorobiaceae bacterium]
MTEVFPSGNLRATVQPLRKVAVLSAALLLVVMLPGQCGAVVKAQAAKSDYFSVTRSVDLLGEVYKEVSENYVDPVNVSEFMFSGIDGMLDLLDPYTSFLDEAESTELDEITSGQYAGIGITIGIMSKDLFITSVIEGQAAEKAGLRIGDRIVAVNGLTTSHKSIEDVRAMIKGAVGTIVKLSVKRDGDGRATTCTLKRAEVRVSTIPYSGLFGSVGYVEMGSFGEHSRDELRSALESLKALAEREHLAMTGIVLDLRGNPGGLLTSAVEAATLFVEKGSRVVSTKGRTPESEQIFLTKNEPIVPSLPLIVLIDPDSASAAEILAGAIQELDRGVIIGEGSYGKGLVQSVIALPYDHVLKLTTAKYYTPSGRLIQKPITHPEGHRKVLTGSGAYDSTKVYYTLNRRKVFGGGGIKPDITVRALSPSDYEQALEKNGMFFRYASRFHAKHPDFQLPLLQSVPVFDDFRSFVESEKFKFRSRPQRGLDSLKVMLRKDGLKDGDSLAGKLDILEKDLGEWTLRRIAQDSTRLTAAVRKELIRHYDQRASRRVAIEADPVAARAFALLSDPKSYRALLKP